MIANNALLSEGKESSVNHAKTEFIRDAKILTTRSLKTSCKLNGSVPIVLKTYKGGTQELKIFTMYVDEKSALLRGSLYSSLSMRILSAKNLRFSLEKPNADGNLAFKDLNLNVNGERHN